MVTLLTVATVISRSPHWASRYHSDGQRFTSGATREPFARERNQHEAELGEMRDDATVALDRALEDADPRELQLYEFKKLEDYPLLGQIAGLAKNA